MALQNNNLNEQLLKIRAKSEERETHRVAESTGVPYFDATKTPVKVDALRMIPEADARKARIAVFESGAGIVAVAALNPKSPETLRAVQELQKQNDVRVKLFAASQKSLEHLWSFYKFVAAEKAPVTSRVNIEEKRIIELTKNLQTVPQVEAEVKDFDFVNLSVTDFLEIIIAGALANRASDIHFEPEEGFIKLRYRIDGVLHDASNAVQKSFYPTIVSRIKLLSNLKINVSDKPQDGRFTIRLPAKDIEIRVAIAPSEFGEIIVLRVLDPAAINLSLSDLGFRDDDLEIVATELKRPHGMILNTGPTGSGKTTTLYAFLKAKHSSEIKIITIEDPIEYHLEGIEQTQINAQAGYTFGNGLRSIMRQDPDAILVGEVRDKETAEIAIQAALTGHLVFSTVHANDAAGAVPRFLDLGVKPTSLAPALNLLIAQRLVRRLCEACKKEKPITADLKTRIDIFIKKLPARVNRENLKKIALFDPQGCEKCAGTGFRGRVAIFELLLNDPGYTRLKEKGEVEELATEREFEELILKSAGENEIQEYAVKQGMVTMQEDGIVKVLGGVTTFEEVAEVTGVIHWL